jgi:Uma2 family endonuclease
VYAEAGVPEHWVADLTDNSLWVWSSPSNGSYRSARQRRRGESIAPQLLPDVLLSVDVSVTD